MTRRTVSIIIPVFNGELYLGPAIESALAQTHPDVEVVVVDDGSTDRSAGVARGFPGVVVIEQGNMGPGAARNAGVAASTGAYVSFLDADDLLMPDKTARQLAVLEADADIDIVFGHVEEFFSEELTPEQRPRVAIADDPAPIHLPTSGIVGRAEFARVGPFSHHRAGQTIDWYLRARELGMRDRMLDDVVYRRRIHHSNQGITGRELQSRRLAVIKESLDRRRRSDDGPPGSSG